MSVNTLHKGDDDDDHDGDDDDDDNNNNNNNNSNNERTQSFKKLSCVENIWKRLNESGKTIYC